MLMFTLLSFLTRFSKGKVWLLEWDMSVKRWADVNNFFHVLILLNFSKDFYQTFTEGLSSSALVLIFSVLQFKHFFSELWPFVSFFFKKKKKPEKCTSVFNSYYIFEVILIELSQKEVLLLIVLRHIIRVLLFRIYFRNYGPLFFLKKIFRNTLLRLINKLLHFTSEFGHTFTRALAHIVSVLWSYCWNKSLYNIKETQIVR